MTSGTIPSPLLRSTSESNGCYNRSTYLVESCLALGGAVGVPYAACACCSCSTCSPVWVAIVHQSVPTLSSLLSPCSNRREARLAGRRLCWAFRRTVYRESSSRCRRIEIVLRPLQYSSTHKLAKIGCIYSLVPILTVADVWHA